MLKGISPLLDADALWVLSSMGHGDDLALVDRNFPAASTATATVSGALVRLDGVDVDAAAAAICALMPLDGFVEDPLRRMEVVGEPGAVLDVHRAVHGVVQEAEGRAIAMVGVERFAFYAAARQAFAVIQTTEARPYGCFLLRKGVI